MTTAKVKSVGNATKTDDKLISLKEQVADLVVVVILNQNAINYHGNKRKNHQANKSLGAQIEQGFKEYRNIKTRRPKNQYL